MDKNVIISLKGIQSIYEKESDAIELVTEGTYSKKDDAYYVTYNESEVTGMKGTTTVLKVLADRVTIVRYGTVNSEFVFEKGQKHLSYFDTAQGAFTIGVITKEMDVKVDDSGGEIRVGYMLDIDNDNTSNNSFLMKIKETGRTDEKYNGDN